MKAMNLGRAIALAVAVLGSAPSQALEIDLGNAGGFSAFVFEDLTTLATSAGRVAVGGNLTVTNASIGAGTPTQAATPALVVRGNVTYPAGALWSGTAAGHGLYGGTKSANTAASLDLRKATPLPVDFDAERVYLTAMSEQLRDLPATGQVAVSAGTLRLTGTNAQVEVFNVTASQVAASQPVVLADVSPDAHIVVNLTADAARRLSFGIDTVALAGWKGRVLFNAHDAETLVFNGLTFWGSVLATNACICNSTGRLEGSVVARKWTAAMNVTFTPFVPKH